MKVLVVSHTYIAPINRDKWKILVENHPNIEMKVIFPSNWPGELFDAKADNVSESKIHNCEFINIDCFFTGNEMLYGYYPRKLIKILRNFEPDIIHVEQGANAFSYFQMILLSKLFRIKTKFSFFTWVNWQPKRSLKYRLIWRLIEKFNIYFSSGAIAGNHDAKEILSRIGINGKISIAPQLGINKDIFYPATKADEFREKKIIGYIGRIVSEKGVFLLANAFAEICKKHKDWNLLFIGSGRNEKSLIDFAVSNKLIDRIDFKDPVDHKKIAGILKKIDILVLPSYDTTFWREQFGHVLIEAMACKIPVIGSTGGEIPNIIKNCGLLFNQKNKDNLKENLELLIQDKVQRNRFGQLGYERVMDNYTHDVIARKTLEFWKELI
jgi:L-malate glycosyltransferase